jgi:hypothetical protein
LDVGVKADRRIIPLPSPRSRFDFQVRKHRCMLKIRAPVVEGNLKVGKAREATPSPNNRGSTLRRRLSDDFFHTTPKIESIPLDSLIQRPSGIPRFK